MSAQPYRQRKQPARPKVGAITGGLRLHFVIAELSPRTAAVGLRFDGDDFASFFTGDLQLEQASLVLAAMTDGGIDTMELLAATWRRVQLPDRKKWKAVP